LLEACSLGSRAQFDAVLLRSDPVRGGSIRRLYLHPHRSMSCPSSLRAHDQRRAISFSWRSSAPSMASREAISGFLAARMRAISSARMRSSWAMRVASVLFARRRAGGLSIA